MRGMCLRNAGKKIDFPIAVCYSECVVSARKPYVGKERVSGREEYRMIAYSEDRQFQAEELGALFSSVQWESARYPERLTRAMQGYSLVISAREEGRLVGLLAAMDDGEMTAYIHYLLVAPDQQRRGIGRELIARAQSHYAGYERIVLHSEGNSEAFYRSLGFATMNAVSMIYYPQDKKQ